MTQWEAISDSYDGCSEEVNRNRRVKPHPPREIRRPSVGATTLKENSQVNAPTKIIFQISLFTVQFGYKQRGTSVVSSRGPGIKPNHMHFHVIYAATILKSSTYKQHVWHQTHTCCIPTNQ